MPNPFGLINGRRTAGASSSTTCRDRTLQSVKCAGRIPENLHLRRAWEVQRRVLIKHLSPAYVTRAYRRPARDEVTRLVALVTRFQKTDSGRARRADGHRVAARFRRIPVPDRAGSARAAPRAAAVESYPLSDYDSPRGLLYFLWSSMPDDALFQAAVRGPASESR
jgi:hypothetical protein